jgi:hypothetical protein
MASGLEARPAAALGPVEPHRVDVLAGDAAAPVVLALAGLSSVVDYVEVLACAARHVVGPGRGPDDLVSARLDERQGTKFAGVGGALGAKLWSITVAPKLSVVRVPGCSTTRGAIFMLLTAPIVAEYNTHC